MSMQWIRLLPQAQWDRYESNVHNTAYQAVVTAFALLSLMVGCPGAAPGTFARCKRGGFADSLRILYGGGGLPLSYTGLLRPVGGIEPPPTPERTL